MPPLLPAMVDLREEPGGDLFLSWTEAPGARNKLIPAAEIARLRTLADGVSLAESQRNAARIVEAYTRLSEALVNLLDGPERALGQRIAEAEHAGRRLDLVVRALSDDRRALSRHTATWMRWELLPFAETRRRGEPPLQVVLQLGPKGHAAPRLLGAGGLRVLFMASFPSSLSPDAELDFEREEEEILTAIAPLAERRRARLRVVEEGTIEDLGAALLVERFDVVHLTGHGVLKRDGPRLVMEDAFGEIRLVSPPELIEVLKRAKTMPELVMISCCHSAEVRGSVASFAAELVAAGVPNVLGWTRPVRDDLATVAAAAVYEQLGARKTPAEARQVACDRLLRMDERAREPAYAWGTLHLVSNSAAGFRLDDGAAPLSERVERDEIYKYLGRHIRVLQTGFVSRRRLVQRLLRVITRGQHVHAAMTRDVAGACVFGMKGVGKSCAVGRVIERAKQRTPELGLVVLHGRIDDRGVLEAFEEAVRSSGGDKDAERLLARTDEKVCMRVRRLMEHWRRRSMVILLDDFEQNLEPRTDGPWLVSTEVAALLEALLPVCATGKPKLLITSTAEFQVPGAHAEALAFEPLGALDSGAVYKLWMRGQSSRDLANVSLAAWQALAERLGRNARVLAWARALCAGKPDAELVAVAARAAAELPIWAPGDEASEEKHAELARLFLEHMAYEQARAAFGEDALTFVRRARVFEAAVPKEAFTAFAAGLAVDLDRDLDALANYGLLEVGELDGARAYRVSSLIEPEVEATETVRWYEAAAEAWERLSAQTKVGAVQLSRTQAAWGHALRSKNIERAERLGRRIDVALHDAGLYADNLRLAEQHLASLPESPFGHQWVGYAEFKAGRPPSRAVDRIQRGHALLVRMLGTEDHPSVATFLHALGSVLLAQGDLPAARNALERSLTIKAKLLGTEDHPSVAASLKELGSVLRAQGDLSAARRALERALAIKAKLLGTEDHPSVAASLHALGSVLRAQGDLPAARKALEHALAIHAKLLGTEDHPSVAASLHELGSALRDLGDLPAARKSLERSLAIKAKVLGTEDHPDVAASLHALGGILRALGDLPAARKSLERSLAIQTKVLGTEDHPDVAASLHALSSVLRAQGDLSAARNFLERSLAIKAKVLGTEDHPSVAASLHALGGVLRAQGDLPAARNSLERSLAIKAKVLGTEDHPDVATSLHELAGLLESGGEFAQAVTHYRRVLAIDAKCFGTRDQYQTAETEVSLAMLLFRLDRQEEAGTLLQHALKTLAEQVPGHLVLQQLRARPTRPRLD